MPFRQFEIATTESYIEVERRVAAAVRPRRSFAEYFKGSTSDKPFEGDVGGSTFRIRRVIRYQNSFLPQIQGDIRSSTAGSVVRVRMTLHPLVAVFILVWLAFPMMSVLTAVRAGDGVLHHYAAPIAMIVIAVVMVVACFYPEARKAERLIRGALGVAG